MVSISALSNITSSSALASGSVSSTGTIDNRGFIYYLSSGLDQVIGDSGVTELRDTNTGTGSFSLNLDGLTAATFYSVRAFARNTSEVGYSARLDFWTLATEPQAGVSALSVSGKSASSIDLSWAAVPGADGYLVLYRTDTKDPDASGINDGTAPANLNLPTGTKLGANVSGTSASLSGLSPAVYRITVIPYAQALGQAETTNYQTAGLLPVVTESLLAATIVMSSQDVASSIVNPGANDQPLYQLNLSVTGSSTQLLSLQARTMGTYASSDIRNLKLWFSGDNVFDRTNDVLLQIFSPVPTPGEIITFSGFTAPLIPAGGSASLFITTDVVFRYFREAT
ncbi:MAG: fibronectin type III domain-containing protein [Bacteroidia bacterium]|nr:fibronectin type III domain-containing protein [Bacteroidia bacterium]